MAIIQVGSSSVADGTSGRDTIYGDASRNVLYGFGGNDRLYGRGGDDDLFGHAGRDTLSGGAGFDNFFFTTRPTKASVDVITDYSKRFDTIVLDHDIFKGLGRTGGWMKASAFWQGAKAHDSDDRILYNSKNGTVYYDPDGTGSKEAIPVVKIGTGLIMAATDFWVY